MRILAAQDRSPEEALGSNAAAEEVYNLATVVKNLMEEDTVVQAQMLEKSFLPHYQQWGTGWRSRKLQVDGTIAMLDRRTAVADTGQG